MRKIIALVLVLYVFGMVGKAVVLAADQMASSSSSVKTFVVQKIEYALPYPGILPDSPLYIFKVVRDRVVLGFIRDHGQKSFYLLLLSDKRLAAGQVLINSGKVSLGVTTMAKAEGYFERAVEEALAAKNQGKDSTDLLSKLAVAAAKHDEVFVELLSKVSGQDADRLEKAYQQSQKSRNRVREVLYRAMGGKK